VGDAVVYYLWCTTVNRNRSRRSRRLRVCRHIYPAGGIRSRQVIVVTAVLGDTDRCLCLPVDRYIHGVCYYVWLLMISVTQAWWVMSAVTYYFCTAIYNYYCSLQLAQLLNNVWHGTILSFVVFIVDLFVCNVEDTRHRTAAGWQIVFILTCPCCVSPSLARLVFLFLVLRNRFVTVRIWHIGNNDSSIVTFVTCVATLHRYYNVNSYALSYVNAASASSACDFCCDSVAMLFRRNTIRPMRQKTNCFVFCHIRRIHVGHGVRRFYNST